MSFVVFPNYCHSTNTVSSAKNMVFIASELTKSFTHSKNNNESEIEPLGNGCRNKIFGGSKRRF